MKLRCLRGNMPMPEVLFPYYADIDSHWHMSTLTILRDGIGSMAHMGAILPVPPLRGCCEKNR